MEQLCSVKDKDQEGSLQQSRLTRKMTSGRSELAFQDKDLLAKPSQTLAGPLLFTGVP